MPDLVGERLDRAMATLEEAGFDDTEANNAVGAIWIFNDDQWAVVEQHPAAGVHVDLDDPVRLGAGPLDDHRTLAALPADTALSRDVEEALAATQAKHDAENAAEAAEAAAEAAKASAEAAEAAASKPVEPSAVGLPIEYAPDHGSDAYERPRPRTIRRDLADYLVAVRATDPATADQIAPALRVVPAAWCSLWLPHHTGAELDVWLAEADASANQMARSLGVSYASSTTSAVSHVMAVARDEAGRRFCPEQSARPGEHVDASPRGAGAFPRGRSPIAMTDTLMDSAWFPNSWSGYDVDVRADEVRLAYLDLLGQPAQYRYYRWWPVVMDCDHYAKVISGEYRDNTVRTIQENNTVFEIHDRADMEQTAHCQAGFYFDALAGQLIRDC